METFGFYEIEKLHMVDDRGHLCQLRYPGHPNGCPNFGKRPDCPPTAPLIHERFDTSQPMFLLVVTWDIGRWAEEMGQKHPKWTERQRYNCLYWQPKVRGLLRKRMDEWLAQHPGYEADTCPEAMGLNVHMVMLYSANVVLEWPPRKLVRKIAIAGMPRKS